ncbi:propanediol dehydratase, partial [Salmonella enterica]|nr:propanediol dehydratase [Salmonella enterica]
MDSNHSAPAIVITVINDCTSLWHEVLLGIEEEGIPFLLQRHPAGDVVDS